MKQKGSEKNKKDIWGNALISEWVVVFNKFARATLHRKNKTVSSFGKQK